MKRNRLLRIMMIDLLRLKNLSRLFLWGWIKIITDQQKNIKKLTILLLLKWINLISLKIKLNWAVIRERTQKNKRRMRAICLTLKIIPAI